MLFPRRPFNLCRECHEVITQPLCSDCLAQSMRKLVSEYDASLTPWIQGCGEEEGQTFCLFCGNSMNLCAHCFSKEVYDFLLEKNPAVAEIFLNRFDFELRRELC